MLILSRAVLLLLSLVTAYAPMRIAAAQPTTQLSPATIPSAAAATQPRFEAELAAFEKQQLEQPSSAHAVVFTGSSSIVQWKTLQTDLAGIPVINRGFGGSTMAETRDALRRIVIPLNPKAVIVYAGSHDLHGPKGKTPEQVAEEFAELCRELRAAQPDVRIGFISCKPSLAKWENIDRDRRLNTLIQNFVAHEPAVFYIDLWSALAPPEGQLPDPRWFQADRNHLSPDAYQELAILVRRALMSEGIAAEVPDR